jgi:hypothetical protein
MDECDIPAKVRGFGKKVKVVEVEGATDRQSWRGTGLGARVGTRTIECIKHVYLWAPRPVPLQYRSRVPTSRRGRRPSRYN